MHLMRPPGSPCRSTTFPRLPFNRLEMRCLSHEPAVTPSVSGRQRRSGPASKLRTRGGARAGDDSSDAIRRPLMGKCVIRLFVEYESDRVGGIGTLGLSSASPRGGAAWRWGVQDKGGRGGLSWPLALVRSCDCETRTQIAANAIVVGRTPVQGSSACLRTEACLTSSGCSGLLRWRRKSAVQGWPTGGGFGLLPGSSLCAGSAHRVLSTGQVPGCGVSSSRLQAGRRLYCASGSLAPALGEGLAVSSEHSDVVSQDVRMYRRKR